MHSRIPLLSFLLTATGLVAAEPAAITHSMLITGGKTYVIEDAAGSTGNVTWRYAHPSREGWVLPSGNVLLAVGKCGAFPKGGAVEVARDQTVVWSYQGTQEEVHSIQKTTDGTYVLTEGGPNPRLLELDAMGKAVVEFPLACQKGNAHMQTRMSRKLTDGTYLCPHLLDFAVIHYDRTGKVLDRIDTTSPGDSEHKEHTWPFTAIRLSDGSTLVGLTNGNRVAEFSSDGKIAWQVTNAEVNNLMKDACGVQRLPNGNTIINSYAAKPGETRLFEVTKDKQVVWQWTSSDGEGVHHTCVFATNGKPLPHPALR
jgi:hypothetical protein